MERVDNDDHLAWGLALAQAVLVLTRAPDFPELMRLARVSARALTGADGVTLVLREGEQCRYADEDAIGPLWKGHSFPLQACISGWAMLHDQAVNIDDIYADPRIPHAAYRPTFVRSLSMAPIRRGDPLGALGCYWARLGGADERALNAQQLLADAIAEGFAHIESRRRLAVALSRADAAPPTGDDPSAPPDLARYRLLVEQAPDGIFLADGEGRYLDVNEAGARMLGYRREEILARGIADIIVPEEIARIPEEVARFAGGAVVTSEWRFLRKDGTTFPGEVVGRRLPDGRLQGILRDIGARRRAEAALRESESFHRQTLESIPGMVFTTRPDGYCDYQSRQWVEYTGVPMREHVGDGWNALLHAEDQPRALAAWRDAVAERAPYDLEYRVRRRDGMYEWFRVIGRPIHDEFGTIVRWFGVAMNIDRLKQAEESLASRNRELEALIDTMPAMVYVKDAALRFAAVNRAVCAVLGSKAEEIVGRGDAEVLPPELARAARESDRMARESRAPIVGIEQSWLDRSGVTRWVSTSKTPLFDEHGAFAGLVGVSVDITEHKQAEERRVANLARQRDALVREVHHRIKNHLQGVTGLLDQAVRDEPALASPLEAVRRRIHAIAQVYGLQGRREDARVVLGDLLRLVESSGFTSHVIRLPADGADMWVAQPEAVPLALVLNELITNAGKHQAAATATRPVRVSLDIAPDSARIVIRNGPAHLPPDFDFASRAGLGTGLELAATLLPGKGSRLDIRQDGDEVEATLTVRAPVVAPMMG